MSRTITILFIAKEKQPDQLSILVRRQMNSLQSAEELISLRNFACKGIGFSGYKSIYKSITRLLKKENFDILHAHYSLIGSLTLLARKKEKVVVSFMGSDVYFNGFIFKIARWIVLRKADHIIVKSERLRQKLPQQQNISVIPNGVNIELFHPTDKIKAKQKLGWNLNKLYILFPAAQNRYEKNFSLAQKAVNELSKKHPIELHLLENIAPDEVPTYLNATDIVLLTSRWEGSSNVTKEAMACNSIVVSTDVGDARELFKDTPGYYLTNHSVEDVVLKLKKAIVFCEENKRTQGRQRILELGLDDVSAAKKIFDIYKKIIQ